MKNLKTPIVIFLIFIALYFYFGTSAFPQQTLTTLRIRVDEINYDQTGPILGPVADQFRDAYIKKLQGRGDIEFVASAAADYQCRVSLNIIPVICGEGEGTVAGYAAAVMLVTRVNKDLIRLDQSMYTASSLEALGKFAGKGTARILGLPPAKEDKEDKKEKPTVVATTDIQF